MEDGLAQKSGGRDERVVAWRRSAILPQSRLQDARMTGVLGRWTAPEKMSDPSAFSSSVTNPLSPYSSNHSLTAPGQFDNPGRAPHRKAAAPIRSVIVVVA